MTPERLKQIARAGEPESDGEDVNPYDFETYERLTWGELRFLLAIAQRAGETCEWVREDWGWANFKGVQFKTSCGQTILAEHDKSRPCWCGRTVAVRDGRT